MRIISLTVAVALLLFGACHKIPQEPGCPETLVPGDRCEYPFQICKDPRSVCQTTSCRCLDQAGGSAWKCQLQYCLCTCPCGALVRSTCDAVGCVDKGGACPAVAADVCALHCKDAGAKDAGGDLSPDGGRDASAETSADARGDVSIDARGDVSMDAKADRPSVRDGVADVPAGSGPDGVTDAIGERLDGAASPGDGRVDGRQDSARGAARD